jgi:D-glycero-D-manno-heptose 1,7-bisphosphate phosphatase
VKLSELNINKTWTLFLDRDGVINLHYPNDYVKRWDEFYFLEGVMDALRSLSEIFRRIIVVTNQQGVGKALMTEDDLKFIHDEMLKEVRKYGGRIHAIYSAIDLVEKDIKQLRKPNTGMAKRAKKDFPEIDFAKSIIVGDNLTDMQFGRSCGMITVFVGDIAKIGREHRGLIDVQCESLPDFANKLALTTEL